MLFKEAVEIIKFPICDLFNKIAVTGRWPSRWNVEHAFPLKKVPNPSSLDEIRSISKSPFLSTKFEKIVIQWLMPFIEPKIDWGQYGGIRGCSVSHLLVELLTFVHYNLDIRKRQGITLTALDYSKAFNRQNHNNFLVLLHKINIP